MEFSVSKSIQNFCEESTQCYPIFSSCPANDSVNPGIAQLINLHSLITPLSHQSIESLKKKTNVESAVSDQIGHGNVNDQIKLSFAHPIITDEIVFPDQNQSTSSKALKRNSANVNDNLQTPAKKKSKKNDHKFVLI